MFRTNVRRTMAATAGVAAILTVTACGSGSSESGGELRLGHVFAIDSTQNEAAEAFAEQLEEQSGGELSVDVYPASQLGGDETLGQDVSRGTLDMAFLNPGSLATMDPLLDFHYLPYIVSDNEQADEIFFGDGIIPQTLSETLAEHNMESLASFELEFRGVSNSKHAVETVDDLRGLKLRVPGSAAIRGFFDSAGAQTQVMPMPELITGLQQDTVDGQDNGVLITHDNSLDRSQAYYTLTQHVYAIGSIVISEETLQGLTDDQQELVRTVAEQVAAEQVEANRVLVEEYLDRVAENVEVTELSEEQLAEFRDFGLSLWDDFAGTYGQDRVDALRAEVEALG
ncbi:TRAP transporter substrate-binding protein [Aeromicrobium sp. CTD01-1L150]|uniref:TRAP transporter substrate-binding protein n=1 Tax=Aeromicrobium sp. CTD01-1L150 TaxID=3341830 RepID=UPI0035BF8957